MAEEDSAYASCNEAKMRGDGLITTCFNKGVFKLIHKHNDSHFGTGGDQKLFTPAPLAAKEMLRVLKTISLV